MKNNNETIIDLTKNSYSDATVLPEEELMHIKQLVKIENLFKSQYDNIENKNECDDCCNDTISVFAKRGYGKTTFVKSFIDKINKNNDYNCCCLDIIDPSKLELKQHPFMYVLALIHEVVEKYIHKNDEMQNPNDENYESFVSWNKAYKNLCKSLSVLDCVGEPNFYKDWDDDVQIAKSGMKRAEDANNLKSNFVKYIDNSLILLHKKCFVLSFDDIDTNFSKGFEILESIRKYLTINKIITILTGDLSLYSKLIRQNLWTGFNSNYFSNEQKYSPDSMYEVSEIINQLEEQYLLKILKPENRITLDSIYEKTKNSHYTIKVKNKKNKTYKKIENIYNDVCILMGYSETFPKTAVMINFIMKLPIRTQMRILGLTSYDYKDKDDFVRGMIRIFRSDISLKSNLSEMDIDNLDNFGPILDFFKKTNCLSRDISFIPETGDLTLDKTLFALGGIINQKIDRSIYLSFDYWIRISYVRKAFEMDIIPQMISYSEINNDNSLNKSYCLSHAFRRSFEFTIDNTVMKPKILPGVCEIEDYSHFTKELNDNPIVGLVLFETASSSERSTCFISIYKLLASIGDIIRNYDKTSLEKSIGNISLRLNTLSQFRSYLEPNKNAPESRKDAIEKRTEFDHFNYTNFKDEASKITNWINQKQINDPNIISVYVLDRIFTRAYFSFSDIEKIRFHNAGEKLNYQIIAFLNAILVEESIDRGISEVNLNSKGNTIEIFFKNLYVTARKSKLLFFRTMLRCPLLIDFIDPYYKDLIYKLEHYSEEMNVSDTVKYIFLKNSIKYREIDIDILNHKVNNLESQASHYHTIVNNLRKYQHLKGSIINKEIEIDNDLEIRIIKEASYLEDNQEFSFENLMNDIRNIRSESFISKCQDLYYKKIIESTSLRKKINIENSILKIEKIEKEKIEKSSFIGKTNEIKESSVNNTLCSIKLQ
ncbi:hypothetical protein [Prevotella sp.]|uniref:hypothetical protein n=1 Tax=Prevotella sp. TaxID=59823 RepID=UPI003DA428B3